MASNRGSSSRPAKGFHSALFRGMTLENTVRAVVYLADIGDYREMNEAYSSYFQTFAAPSRVAMEVAALVGGGTIEISFIAVKN